MASCSMATDAEREREDINFVLPALQRIYENFDGYYGPRIGEIANSYKVGSGKMPKVRVLVWKCVPGKKDELISDTIRLARSDD